MPVTIFFFLKKKNRNALDEVGVLLNEDMKSENHGCTDIMK